MAELRGRANEAAALAFWFAIIGGLGGVVIALAVAALIARSILQPLSSLKSAALAVAKGDLEMRAPVSGPQELAQLGTSLNQMTESLLDASKRRELEEEREQAEEMFKTLANSSPIGIFVAQDGKFQFVNPQFQTYTGYSEDELLDTECLKLVLPEDRRTVRENAIKMLKGEGSSPYEYRVITKGGETIWIMEKVASIHYQGRIATLGYYMDISERKQAEEIIRHLAYHDELTGLPNRKLLKDRLDIALAQARRQQSKVAMMFLDLDGFKIINDTLGHVKGDQILQMVGARLMGVLREGDTVARMGGDEFALLFPAATETEEALRIADRVAKGFDRPFVVDGQEFNVTASIGVALYPDHAASAEGLIKSADMAMYRARDRGPGHSELFSPVLRGERTDRPVRESDLREALKRNDFVIHYQPQVDVRSGKVVGAEALVRWQHPVRGTIFPDDFIPLAEETGLILPLGEWVLRTACAQNKAWPEARAYPIRMAVNISPRQFRDPDLVRRVTEALNEAGLAPNRLMLEVTGHAVIQDIDVALATLEQLHVLGVEAALDDFGSGLSSLSRLQDLPVQALKIDRALLRDVVTSHEQAAIAAGAIAVAHKLGLRVIAEGVETQEQLAFLKEQGCDEYQGYLFSKPWPAKAFEWNFSSGRRRSVSV